jgi:hypothetical protein
MLSQMIKENVSGNGFLRVRNIPLRDVCLASDASTLTTTLTTNPGFACADTNTPVLAWAATKVVEAAITFQIPDDYDESNDVCKLILKSKMGGTTDATTGFTVDVFKASAPTTDLALDDTAYMTSSYTQVELDISGQGLTAGEVVTVQIAPNTHGTDAVYVAGIKMEYRSDLCAFDPDDR